MRVEELNYPITQCSYRFPFKDVNTGARLTLEQPFSISDELVLRAPVPVNE